MNPYKKQLSQYKALTDTENKICQSFIELYKKYSFEQITIKEICNQIPIARTTFYRYFNNTWEVKEVIEDNFVAGLLKSSYDLKFFDYTSENYILYLQSTLDFLEKNKDIFKLFLVTRCDPSFLKKYKISIKYHYYDLCLGNKASLEIISGYLISIFTYFLSQQVEFTMKNIDKYAHVLENLIDSLDNAT